MKSFYEELLEHDLNPYLVFDSNGKLKSFNKEAEFLLNFASLKELFDLAVANASHSFGFNHKFVNVKYSKLEYYAILVGYANDDEIALRLYKAVTNEVSKIDDRKLKLVNIYSLIDLSKNSTLLNSDLKIDEVYDISLPEMKIDINNFLLLLNECFNAFVTHEELKIKVHLKIGEYEVINGKKYQIIVIEFVSKDSIQVDKNIDYKADDANANVFVNDKKLKIELPIIN